MTGLDLSKDVIIEIACIITNGQLEIVSKELELVIHQSDEMLNNMNEWCIETHGKSGLTGRVRSSILSTIDAQNILLGFIKEYVPEKNIGILAGNSVHVDRQFLSKEFPKIIDHLHYRIVDVSTVKELSKRWFPIEFQNAPKKALNHRALEDIRESINELKYYQRSVFKTEIIKDI